jgi:uncharacterized protein YeaO (DUF488 family)
MNINKNEYLIKVKRIYEPFSDEDGFRILVDRLWPRGISKEKAKINLWLKEISPSTELRRQFCHDPAKWDEFRGKYFLELKSKKDFVSLIIEHIRKENVTLLYAAKDNEFNNAVAIKEFIEHLL